MGFLLLWIKIVQNFCLIQNDFKQNKISWQFVLPKKDIIIQPKSANDRSEQGGHWSADQSDKYSIKY